MSTLTGTLAVLLLPLVWLGAIAFAVTTLLLDLLCAPFVALLRRRPADRPTATRNASIVVLNWNGLHFLRELMPSLQIAVARCPGDHEVIVVDNGSDDGSVEWLARDCAWAKLVRLPRNVFFIRGNAAGARVATRDLLVYLNNDMRVEPDWLVGLLRPFADATAGDLFATTSRIEMHEPRTETGLTRCFLRHGEIRFVQQPGQPGPPVPALWAGGGSSAFDRSKHDALGGFEDLYFPMYGEDASLSWQGWRRGWRVLYVHDSVVHHAHRGSATRRFGRQALERLAWRNRELFLVRNVTAPWLVLLHALCMPWNLRKHAKLLRLSLADGVRAWLAAVPRLPRALWLRQTARRHYRRSDRALLRAVNDPR
ncbi:MAG: glycosyltransferase [Planctomycetota bacterium]